MGSVKQASHKRANDVHMIPMDMSFLPIVTFKRQKAGGGCQGWREGMTGVAVQWKQFLFRKMEKFGDDGRDGCTAGECL